MPADQSSFQEMVYRQHLDGINRSPAGALQLGDTLHAWSNEIAAMWRFSRNGITESFHNLRLRGSGV